jgi:hypothetical protein
MPLSIKDLANMPNAVLFFNIISKYITCLYALSSALHRGKDTDTFVIG